ncbi:MAG: TetR family transcriptional regulator [Cytophagaceae bacterium]|nr:TetR family transcriptional regulator [Cytophagaceae bacterium]|tara:strand:- start:8042 stop:8641 length:600 start_codon:yes stop_codon:yes gene_type:complete
MGRKSIATQRRKEVINAFYDTAREIGLENTSIAKVANKMNISQGLVMHYFKTKDELLIGLNKFILEQHLKIINAPEYPEMDTRKSLEEFITSLFSRKWNQYFDDGVFYSCYALIYRIPEFKQEFKSYLEELHLVLNEKLAKARELNVIKNDNIDELTEIIFALIDGAYYYLGLFDENNPAYRRQENLYINYAIKLLDFS